MNDSIKKVIPIILVTVSILFVGFFFFAFFFGFQGKELGLSVKGGGYDLSQPVKVISFKDELKEISGLGYLNDTTLVAAEDEKGVIYTIDYQTEQITGHYPFAKKGDFEGITVAGDRVYVLRSNGKIYDVQDLGKITQKDDKYITEFTSYNDLEGICYYEKEQGLLLACKGSSLVFKDLVPEKDERYFYIFDLKEKVLRRSPAFILNFAEVRKLTGLRVTPNTFLPSGIAVHPLTGDIYIISSAARMMLITGPDGTVKWALTLNREMFKQPEGICFSPDGTLFISNEGREGDMSLLIYSYSSLAFSAN